MDNRLLDALSDVCRLCDERTIAYAVMGGIAVRAHGIPRATYDVDIIVSVDRARLPDLYTAVTDLGYTVPEPYESGWVDQVAGMPLVRFRLDVADQTFDVDIFLAETDFLDSAVRRRQLTAQDGRDLWLVTAEDLVLLKLLAGRTRDHSDINDILLVQGKN